MGLLRSETMKAGTVVLPADRAREYISEFANLGCIQFEDMHANHTVPFRAFRRYMQRLDEMERVVRFLMDEVKKIDYPYTKYEYEGFLKYEGEYKMEALEAELTKMFEQFTAFKKNNEGLVQERNVAIEERCVAEVAHTQYATYVKQSGNREALLGGNRSNEMGMAFSSVAGVVNEEEQQRFARFLFRVTRGNTYTSFTPIEDLIVDPKTMRPCRKSVFVVYFQDNKGAGESAMYQRIMRACVQFGVNNYDWPETMDDARVKLRTSKLIAVQKEAAQQAFEEYCTQEYIRLLEVTPSGNCLLEDWRMFVAKEKSIYGILNLFEGAQTMHCDVWYPEEDEDRIRRMLINKASMRTGSALLITDRKVKMTHAPTYFKCNDLTAPAQTLIDTYGVPRYKEANPALFSVVTFPFIFGIMYGDVGHGGLLLLFSIWLCCNAEKLKNTAADLVWGRYMLLMMGFFATYAGFLYNDFFSLGMNLFGSRWVDVSAPGDVTSNFQPDYDVKNEGGRGPYPFGVDPAWVGADNELLYMNSLKMKLSVLVGVAQMLLGVFLRFSNAIHFRSAVDFLCECIPMLIFMVCFFGYMDYMILYKWVTPLEKPPGLINSLIAMAMRQNDPAPLWDGAYEFETKLMIATAISVPWLLIPKPLCLIMMNPPEPSHGGEGGEHLPLPNGAGGAGDSVVKVEEEEHEHHAVDEIVIHQIIETIEFVLGTVSHTASYLRQWALSLAHQQLSLVFFQKILSGALSSAWPMNIIFIFIAWYVWFLVTLGVLLGMDVLECFLHTLRLHWVEFNSKFYKADGVSFAPYKAMDVVKPKDN